jgi:hypothetical protein
MGKEMAGKGGRIGCGEEWGKGGGNKREGRGRGRKRGIYIQKQLIAGGAAAPLPPLIQTITPGLISAENNLRKGNFISQHLWEGKGGKQCILLILYFISSH